MLLNYDYSVLILAVPILLSYGGYFCLKLWTRHVPRSSFSTVSSELDSHVSSNLSVSTSLAQPPLNSVEVALENLQAAEDMVAAADNNGALLQALSFLALGQAGLADAVLPVSLLLTTQWGVLNQVLLNFNNLPQVDQSFLVLATLYLMDEHVNAMMLDNNINPLYKEVSRNIIAGMLHLFIGPNGVDFVPAWVDNPNRTIAHAVATYLNT